jgi:signal transduction histidine kinase
MTTVAADHYASIVSHRVFSQRLMLAERWLSLLKEVLPVEPNEVFPSDQLLDHIPLLIAAVADYLRAPNEEEIAANTAVIDKARELGVLRHAQRASAHQLLREYEILGEIVEAFLAEETERLALTPSFQEYFRVLHRLTHAIRMLMRTTVDTFISEYTTTIQDQNERIKAFNRAASHELRSPIGTILFAATLLEKDAERVSQQRDRLAKIGTTVRTNAERLGWLVENLQRMVRLTEPLDVPSQQQVNVETIASEVARQLSDMASARQVSIRIAPGLPTLLVDPARLELILLNLVSNAIKYSDPEKSESYVEIRPVPEDGDHPSRCTIAVRDNGLGIPEADQEAIFERFFRAHTHLDDELGVSGSGLGLAIVADCVGGVTGTIRCESTAGRGTTFFITLPCEPATAA